MGDSLSGIVLDVMNLSVIALMIGLVTFAVVRRANPLLRWHEQGNVWTGPFRFEDLLVVFALVAFYYYQVHVSAHLRDTQVAEGPSEGAERSEGMVAGMLLIGILLQITITGVLLFFLTYLRRIELTELFGIARMKASQAILWSTLGMVVVFPVVVAVAFGVEQWMTRSLGIDKPDVQEVVKLFLENRGWLVRGLTIVSACAVAPVAEEIIFRGFLYAAIKRHSERFFAAIVTSTIFAAVHGTASGLLPLWVLAMCLTLAYEITGCLWVPILMHAIFNSVQTVIMITYGG
jgi:membrane protease YdiL (CAAX protease family)